jgi:hypothetical protein
MRRIHLPVGSTPFSALLGLAALFTLGSLQLRGADDTYDGAVRCRDCHAKPAEATLRSATFVLLTEYAVWKTEDKHAQAYAVLKNNRSENMGKLLGNVDVTDIKVGCINCHALGTLKNTTEQFKREDGVSCAGCHGPSEKWINDHSLPKWRLNTPEQKSALKMTDLRDPAVRAELCMSCHVGKASEGKVVTHEMFAAGHPPLPPFDVATFSRNLPPHWREPKDVPYFKILQDISKLEAMEKPQRRKAIQDILSSYRPATQPATGDDAEEYLNLYKTADDAAATLRHYPVANQGTHQTRLALMGNVIAFRETMRLVAERSDKEARGDPEKIWLDLLRKPRDDAPWPNKIADRLPLRWNDVAEAHSECYACHHDLQYPGYRQKRGYGYRLPDGDFAPMVAGRVPIRSWPMTLTGVSLSRVAKNAPAEIARARTALVGLVSATNAKPFGDPEKLASIAGPFVAAWDKPFWTPDLGEPDKLNLPDLVKQLCNLGSESFQDYESARQLASVLRVGVEEWSAGKEIKPAVRRVVDELEDTLNLKFDSGREARRKVIYNLVMKDIPIDKSDAKQFWKSVENPGDRMFPWALEKNDYLTAIIKKGNVDLNEAMLQEVKGQLEPVAQKELEEALKKVAAYDADAFRTKIKALAAALAEK